MDETNDRTDLGEMEVTEAFTIGHTQIGEACKTLPEGVWRVYAERAPDKPLNERMAHYWVGWWGPAPPITPRMQMLIDEFGLVERSKLPDPPEVPEDVKKAASDLPLVYGGATPPGHVGTLLKWVLEQVGETDG